MGWKLCSRGLYGPCGPLAVTTLELSDAWFKPLLLFRCRCVDSAEETAAAWNMDDKKQMEEFQYAYVAALAAHAGLNRGDLRVDDDSVDVQFAAAGLPLTGPYKSPSIQFQLKCTRTAKISGGQLSFDLKIKNYDDLREHTLLPRYLAVLVVPTATADWLTHSAGCISLQNECYWVSLKGKAASTNSYTITVKVPLANKLTASTLMDMIDAASYGASI